PVYEEQMEKAKDRWQLPPVLESCKAKAKNRGLWHMFLTADRETGDTHGTMGLSNLEYAPICEVLGRSSIASESVNCSAPDTSNMEVFARYGSKELKEKWLKPLLNGEIRSCFAMTEPAVASSDARNVECRIESDGDNYVINGRKWWSSGMGDPRCKVIILMGKSDPSAPAYRQQSMIVVPRDTAGIKIVKMLHVFGYDDAPHGHAEVVYDNVRVPKGNILLGEGRGFEIAQGRLAPAASARSSSLPACMPTSARCAWPTGRTRSIVTRSGGWRSPSTTKRPVFGSAEAAFGRPFSLLERQPLDLEIVITD